MSAGAITGTASSLSGSGSFGQLKSDDFIKVMLSELQNQDPFQPQDSSKLLEQLSSLRNIESQMSLQQQLESLVLQNQIAMAGGLLGKMVGGLSEDDKAIVGLVTSVRVENGKAMLELDTGQALEMGRLTQIVTH